jgi:hypothetical protein
MTDNGTIRALSQLEREIALVDQLRLIDGAFEELTAEDRMTVNMAGADIHDSQKAVAPDVFGLGPVSQKELLYKLGRFLNEYERS